MRGGRRDPIPPGEEPSTPWHHAAAAKIEVLTQLGRDDEALCYGLAQVAEGGHPGRRHARVLRALALAEARAGRHGQARRRLTALLERMVRRQARGVEVALVHEALALSALQARDVEAFREHAARAAEEYHRSQDSGFAARYALLRHTIRDTTLISDIPPAQGLEVGSAVPQTEASRVGAMVQSTLEACEDAARRTERGLALLCELAGASRGFLFLLDGANLARVASLPGSVPGEGLEALAARVMESEARLDDQPTLTSVLTGEIALDAHPPAWTDPDGRSHHPLHIRARLAGESAVVGVAVIEASDPAAWSPEVMECAAALGDRFLRSGDTSTALTTADRAAMPAH